MSQKSILLIISGSIAAYKSLDLIRRLTERGIEVRCILTRGGEQFVTPLSIASLTGTPVYQELFSLKDETEMGHIRLSREADLIVVAPASADLIAKMAQGYADDLASTTLLASNKTILVAPAMNTRMWQHPAVVRNVKQIAADGCRIIEPGAGMLACGEIGAGRMAEPEVILEAILAHFNAAQPLKGIKALVTSGPTHEDIDPVRYIGNRSSGRQGHAIAAALARQGAEVILVTGPTEMADPAGVTVKKVTSARQMLEACEKSLPVDVAVCAAAVGDWRAESTAAHKLKKRGGESTALVLVENTDILHAIATHPKKRPALVVGFAAETGALLKNATDKRRRKGADWIVANDVSDGKVFGAGDNEVTLVTAKGAEPWPLMSKEAVAERLVERIAGYLKRKK